MDYKNKILSKCVYFSNNFDSIINYWINNIGAKKHDLSSNTFMLNILEDDMVKLINADKIPVDCRIFALMCSDINPRGFSMIIQKNNKGIEISVPENCVYLSLSKKINICKTNDNTYELKLFYIFYLVEPHL